MSDKTVMLRILRTLPGVLFVEPSRELYMQDEVHDRARQLLQQRGLPADHPYIGWHAQANGFDGKGQLHGAQRIYFGGSHEVVGRALAALEAKGFAVLGGQSDDEAFVVYHDATPERVDDDPEQLEAWRTRLEVLGADRTVAVPRPGEVQLLHKLVAASSAAADSTELAALLVPALRTLRLRDELTDADLDIILTPERVEKLGNETSPIVVTALERKHPLAIKATRQLTKAGTIDGKVLVAWGGPEALEAARVLAITKPRHIPYEYMTLAVAAGQDPIEAGLDLAQQVRAAHHSSTGLGDYVLQAMYKVTGGNKISNRLRFARDPRMPLWLRLEAMESKVGWPRNPAQCDARASYEGAKTVSAHEQAEANALLDELRRESGLPPRPGYDITSRQAQDRAIEQREYLIENHLAGLLAALHSDELTEPALAVLLELLYPAGVLTAEVLDPLLSQWKQRFFVKPDTYTPAAPAVVTLAVACTRAGHPKAAEIVRTVMKDTRKWSEPHRYLLRGGLDWGETGDLQALDELSEVANSGSSKVTSGREARHAVAQITARLRGINPVRAASELAADAPASPPYIRLGYAYLAIGFSEGGSGLWPHYFREFSPKALTVALRLASDESLPSEARRNLLYHAANSYVLKHPLNTTNYAVMPKQELLEARVRLAELQQQLGVES